METWIQVLVTVITSLLASSGLWAFLSNRVDKSHAEREMMTGLGHDRIIFLGMRYVERGYITHDEYENLYQYLYKPYKKLGGNGSADRVMDEVKKLPIRSKGFEGMGVKNDVK